MKYPSTFERKKLLTLIDYQWFHGSLSSCVLLKIIDSLCNDDGSNYVSESQSALKELCWSAMFLIRMRGCISASRRIWLAPDLPEKPFSFFKVGVMMSINLLWGRKLWFFMVLTTTTSFIITVKPFIVKQPEDVSVVSGEEIRLGCVAEGKPKPEIRWSRRAGNIPASRTLVKDNSVLTILHANPDDQDMYVCTAENQAGTVTAVAKVRVNCKYQVFSLSHFLTIEKDYPGLD